MLTLHMFIDDLLIDSVEVDVSFCKTLRDREDQVRDAKVFMSKENLDKIFISNTLPHFILTGSSKVGQIIRDDTEGEL
jgi:hypothetical protein